MTEGGIAYQNIYMEEKTPEGSPQRVNDNAPRRSPKCQTGIPPRVFARTPSHKKITVIVCGVILFVIVIVVICISVLYAAKEKEKQGISTEAPYGSWKSPLSSKLASDSSISIREIFVDPSTPDILYWSESHPKENGRIIVFSKDIKKLSSTPERWTPADKNVRDRVHSYGGGPYFVHGGDVYFVNFKDQQIYKQSGKGPPIVITRGKKGIYRYADCRFSGNEYFFFCVREDHSTSDPVNTIVAINVRSGKQVVMASGYDFYAYPRVSPGGKMLVWMQWKHPNMPWDDTEIWLGDISSNNTSITVGNQRKVAGENNTNFMEPRWTYDGKLLYISDRTGWWNLYMTKNLVTFKSKNVCKKEAEIGTPCWLFGHRSYSPHPVKTDLVAVIYHGKPSLLNMTSGSLENIDVGNYITSSCLFQPGGKYLIMVASSPKKPRCIMRYDMKSKQIEKLQQPMKSVLDEGYLSLPKHVKFPVNGGKAFAYGYYYKPTNKDFHAPAGTLPPLLINVHGGPTSSAGLSMHLVKQYFTSRGIAILDVNYRGSSGYGTAFRKALYGKWGVSDIEDVCAGAKHMSTIGVDGERVNKDQLLISGGSSGGYTTLAALTFRKVFTAGVSYYGISDLSALAKFTHKFESRYMDRLVAPYPQGKAIYDARSPIKHLDQFKTACAFFQGNLDRVVPPDQTRKMYKKIYDKGIPCAMVLFPDEGHGFRRSENQQKSLDGEFYFYSKILRFKPADKGIKIPIENLPNGTSQQKSTIL